MSSLHAYDWTTGFEQLQRRFACLDTEFNPPALAGKPVRRRLCLSCRAVSDQNWQAPGKHDVVSRAMLQAYTPHPTPLCHSRIMHQLCWPHPVQPPP